MTVATVPIHRPAIGPEQQDTIIARMKRLGQWSGRRMGRKVRFWTRPTREGRRIAYQVHLRWATVCHGTALSVADAIAAVNATLSLTGGAPDASNPTHVIPYDQLRLRQPERERIKDN